MSSEPKIQEIVALWAMVDRMRVLCFREIATAADKITRLITDTFFEPPKTTAQLHDLMKQGQGADPFQEFSEAAREGLRALTL